MHPIAGVMREDTRCTGTVSLTKRDFNIWGYAPAIEYTYIYNDSNISIYELRLPFRGFPPLKRLLIQRGLPITPGFG